MRHEATLTPPPLPTMSRPRSALYHDLIAAAFAGQLAGLMMAIAMMAVFMIFMDKGPLYPVQVIGSFILGDRAIQGFNISAVAVGLLLHQFGPTLLWSVIFGAVAYALSSHQGITLAILGVSIGVASQIVDVNLILPIAMNGLHGHNIWAEEVPMVWSWAAHIIFGLGLTTFFPWVHGRIANRFA